MQRSSMMKTHTYSKKQMEEKPNPSVASSSSTTYGMPPPTNSNTATRLAQIDEMKYFFATATQHWEHNKSLKRFALPGGSGSGAATATAAALPPGSGASPNGTPESISCVLWNDLFFITGTDIVRSLTFRFHAFGRPVTNAKKFEEGIFSDLRNLKPGHDARLEEPKSDLLDMLYKNNCIRTQKKQKVFYWFSVPHDRLFLDALERDLKREKMGMEPTTQAVAEPAASLSLDSTQELFDQLRKSISQSAAATAQAIEDDLSASSNSALSTTPVPNSSLSLNSIHQHHSGYLDTDPQWPTSPTPSATVNHTPWSSSQSRLERAASQAKRSRVNSVPASLGQKQQMQLLQQQQQLKSHRLSYGSYFAGHPISTHSSTASRRNNRRISSTSSSMLSSPTTDDVLFRDDASNSTAATGDPSSYRHHHPDYMMDPIANGVNQLEITPSLSNTSHSTSTSSSMLQHTGTTTTTTSSSAVLPSKSLDSNAIKKTKTIFGNLSLFDGSPTYKQRRRRAASVSSSVLNQPHPLHITAGGPERVVRRHDKCHLRTPSSATGTTVTASTTGASNMVNSNSSRLAMAAVKAGFAPNQIITMPSAAVSPSMITTANHSHGWRSSTSSQDYYCPMPDCRHLFKRPEHLERHMQSLHMFVCNVCGKHFPRSDHLAQHHRLEHEIQQYDHVSSLSGRGDNNNDDDDDVSSPQDDYQRNFMFHATYGTRQQQQQQQEQQQHQQHQQHHQHHQQQQQMLHQRQQQPQDTGFYSSSSRHSLDDARSSGGSGSMAGSSNSNSRCSTLSPMLDLDFDMPDIQPTTTTTTTIQPTDIIHTPMSSSRSNTSLTTTESSSIILNDRQQHMFNASYYPEPSTSTFIKEEPHWSANGLATAAAAAAAATTTRAPAVQKSSSCLEDDFSSSSASSPSSTLQYTGDPFNNKVDMSFASSSSSNLNHLPMTLLSPFKPTQLQQQHQHQQHQQQQHHQQQQQQQQQLQLQQMQEDHHLLQMTHLSEPYSNYAHHHQPFDVNMDSMFPNNSTNPNPIHENSPANNYQSIYAPYVDQQYSPFITSPDNMNIVFGA